MLITEVMGKYNRTVQITPAQFKEYIPKIQVALQKAEQGVHIYRGSPHPALILYTDPTQVERLSRNTSNEMTLILSHVLPSWTSWPKRSRSLICSENPDIASAYSNGGASIVLPLGNPLIGIVPSVDFWDSFDIQPPDFNYYFQQIVHDVNVVFNLKLPPGITTIEEMNMVLDTFDELVKKYPEKMESGISRRSGKQKILADMLYSGDCRKALDKFLNPTVNKFQCVPLSEYKTFNSNEVWLSAPSILIKRREFDRLMN